MRDILKYKARIKARNDKRRLNPIAVAKMKEYAKKWYQSNRKQILARMGSSETKARRRILDRQCRLEFIAAYGGACTCCGENREAFLTLEHINHDGKHDRKRPYYRLRKLGWPKDGYTLLCWNCNIATRYGDLCPHKT